MKKRRHSGGDKTIFQIDRDNQGDFRSGDFKEKFQADPPVEPEEKKLKRGRGESAGKKQRHVGSEPGEKDPVGLRIIGGKFRGSKLQYIGDNRVRPMKDRVREAVFNLIGPVIKGLHVIDLFGGTGALAIEAISRGAVSATIIELHLPTAAQLRKNLESLDLLGICELRKTDAFFWAKNREEHPPHRDGNRIEIPWIVFCSPPYQFYVDQKVEMLEMLDNLYESAPTGSLFVVESDDRFDFDELPVPPPENKVRSYPPAKIGIFYKEPEQG